MIYRYTIIIDLFRILFFNFKIMFLWLSLAWSECRCWNWSKIWRLRWLWLWVWSEWLWVVIIRKMCNVVKIRKLLCERWIHMMLPYFQISSILSNNISICWYWLWYNMSIIQWTEILIIRIYINWICSLFCESVNWRMRLLWWRWRLLLY